MVDWHVVKEEWFALEIAVVLEGVRLDQSPRGSNLGIKIAVYWE